MPAAQAIKNPNPKFVSLHGDVPLPDYVRHRTLTSLMLEATKKYGDKPAFIDHITGESVKFSELEPLVRRFGAGLTARGFKQGDVFGLYTRNTKEWWVVFHGVMSMGGIVTTCNPAYTAGELHHQMEDSGAKWLMTQSEFLDKATEATRGLPMKHSVMLFDQRPGWTSFADIVDNDGSLYPNNEVSPDDVCVIPYSSGTSGKPKGVQLVHRSIMANLFQCSHPDFNQIGTKDTIMGFLPFYHIYGMVVVCSLAIFHGASVVVMPAFDLEVFLKTIERFRITACHLVPPILLLMAKSPVVDKYDLSSLQEVLCGAAPLGVELGNEVIKRLGLKMLRQGYGMTELGTVCHMTPCSAREHGTAGRLVPNTEMLIVDSDTGEPVGVGKPGEVWIRGPQVMKGYLNRPDATAETVDSEGFLHTGDVGIVDKNGYLTIVDRVKELIKFRGLQVAPAELEALLLTNPHIADAAVIGIPEEGLGESPKGYIVRKPGATITGPEVQEFVAKQVSPHKKLREIEFVSEIPKSTSGKILRRFLRDRETEKRNKSKL